MCTGMNVTSKQDVCIKNKHWHREINVTDILKLVNDIAFNFNVVWCILGNMFRLDTGLEPFIKFTCSLR